MSSLGEETAAGLGRALAKASPIAPLLRQAIDAQAAQQHIIGRLVLGVQLEPVALEPLHLEGLTLDELLLLRADREAEDRQAAVLLPERADAPGDAETSLGKAALGGLRADAGRW